MLLVVNAGSSSIKVAVFDADLTERLSARVTEIGGAAELVFGPEAGPVAAPDHHAALMAIFAQMGARGLPLTALGAAAHRVVHGGEDFIAPCKITPAVLAGIEACVPLAPLHNPANLTAIRALARIAPDLPQYASFDTAFHATNPAVATSYALPGAERARGLRRYGFHGLSYASIVRKVQEIAEYRHKNRLLAFHLGNGASLCAILNGCSQATTMGYSPLDGLTMGSRSGSMDGNAVLRLAQLHGVEKAGEILNRQSGLLGLGGHSDMRSLHAAATPEADFALQHFIYWAVRHAGSMIAAMGGLDAIAFTGGIGENDAAVRQGIVQGLGWMGAQIDPRANGRNAAALQNAASTVAIWIVPAEEERQIALEALHVMKLGAPE